MSLSVVFDPPRGIARSACYLLFFPPPCVVALTSGVPWLHAFALSCAVCRFLSIRFAIRLAVALLRAFGLSSALAVSVTGLALASSVLCCFVARGAPRFFRFPFPLGIGFLGCHSALAFRLASPFFALFTFLVTIFTRLSQNFPIGTVEFRIDSLCPIFLSALKGSPRISSS